MEGWVEDYPLDTALEDVLLVVLAVVGIRLCVASTVHRLGWRCRHAIREIRDGHRTV